MNYSSIVLFDVANGPGIRVSLFVSGCQFHCEGCFNQECQNYDYGKPFTEVEEEMILKRLEHPDFAGLSLLGGDPMWQDVEGLKRLANLCSQVHALGKTVWLWTGFTQEEILNPETQDECSFMRKVLLNSVDVLVDGRFIFKEKDLSLPWRGSANQKIINLKEK